MTKQRTLVLALAAAMLLSACGAEKKAETAAPTAPAALPTAPVETPVEAPAAPEEAAAMEEALTWAAKLGETSITPGLYRLNLMSGLNQVGAALNLMSIDDVLTAEIDGMTGKEYAEQFAQTESARQLAIHDAFVSRGLTLSEEEITTYKEYASQTYTSMQTLYQFMGVTEEDMELLNLYSIESYALFANLYGEGGSMAASAEERRAYFEDNTNLSRIVLFYKFDPTTYQLYDEEQLKAESESAAAYLERAQSGESFTHLQWERTNELLASMGQDPVEQESEDLETYNMTVPKVDSGNYPENLVAYLNEAENGEIKLLEDDYFLIIAEKLDIKSASDDYVDAYYDNMLPTLKQNEFYDLTMEWASSNQGEISYNDEALEKLSAEQVIDATKAYTTALQQLSASTTQTIDK